MLPIIFFVPIFQLIVLAHAATYEMKHIRLLILDRDHSTLSRELIGKFAASPYYMVTQNDFGNPEALRLLEEDRIHAVLEIPTGFEERLKNREQQKLSLQVNAINGTTGGLVFAQTGAILGSFGLGKANLDLLPVKPKTIEASYLFWYNEELNYKTFMVPGILVLLVTVISLLLSSMNIVREKEIGTIEQINVTPIKKYQFIIGKLLPFLLIALFELCFGLGIGKLLFNIPMIGSLGLVFGVAVVYIACILGLGLLVSTITNTQQQSMFVSFFMMMIFILMSGLFTAIENMPDWAMIFNKLNPVAYFIRVMRMVLLKGSGFSDIVPEIVSLSVLMMISLSVATWRYRKTT
jgi:ABC-2 type transport system permease protein